MIEDVFKRLDSLGYIANSSDEWVLGFVIDKVEAHINNTCNTTSVPDGLHNIAIDMVCGEFLFTKKQSGQLTLNDLDLNGSITSIHEGDTTVNFGGLSDEEKLTSLLDWLKHHGEGDLLCYRQMQW